MGIPGLTTFIENRANTDLYMDDYKLHDTNLVIDGNSLACQMYRWYDSNLCFGGDYDKYGHIIMVFFESLSKCKITPYLVFDGGIESSKMKTIMQRMQGTIKTAEQMSGATNEVAINPLFVLGTLRDIGLKMEVKMVQCDFEGDTDVANIARTLGCPVLSCDSDFYIFDGLYIPFNAFNRTVKRNIDLKTNTSYYFLQCKMYNVDKFLSSFGQADRSILPLLAVILGNDHVDQRTFSLYNLRERSIPTTIKRSQNHIAAVLSWLENETRESAIRKVLGMYTEEKREMIMECINKAIKVYNCFDSMYLKYLGLSSSDVTSKEESREELIDFVELGKVEDTSEPDDESESHGDQEIIHSEDNRESIIFKENFRKCLYPNFFMDMIFRHKYYLKGQVEDITVDNSHIVSFDIIAPIFKILTGLSEGLACVGRVGGSVGEIDVPAYNDPVPTLGEIEDMDCAKKQEVFFKILKLDDSLKGYLSSFPDSWHLYILAIKYAIDKSKLNWPLIYSFIVSKLIISCIDYKIGFIRSVVTLMKNYAKKLSAPIQLEGMSDPSKNILDCLNDISTMDSIHCMNSLIQYFLKDQKIASGEKFFDRNLVHSISEFQSILFHLKHLNNLLQKPFHDFSVSDCLNCTFVYNFTADLAKQGNIKNYLNGLLCKAPSVLTTVHAAVSAIDKTKSKPPPKKQKKKKVRNDQYKKCSNSVSMSFRGT